MTLEALDPDRCPDCGAALEVATWLEPALVRHGGYGAALRSTLRTCPACPYTARPNLTTETPPR